MENAIRFVGWAIIIHAILSGPSTSGISSALNRIADALKQK